MTAPLPDDTPTLAITGATGFIGGWLVDMALERGYKVRALTRRPQTERAGVTWISGRLEDKATLEELVEGCAHVVHLAALVKARSKAEFTRINVKASENLAHAFAASTDKPENGSFVYLSSFAAREPHLSDYAASKREGEDAIKRTLPARTDWIILRAPAVYGEGDKEILPLIKFMTRGFAFAAGSASHRFSLLHAADVCRAIMAVIEAPEAAGESYELDDASATGYIMQDIADIVGSITGRRVRAISLPAGLVKFAGHAGSLWSRISGAPVMLTRAKVNELLHPDWVAQNNPLSQSAFWQPETDLKQGLARTIEGYRKAGWL